MANGTLLNVPITFNGVSVGKEKVSVGIGIDHSRVTREQMGEMFVNRTLDIDLCTGEPDAQPLPGMDDDDVKIEATVTASSYSEKKSSFGTRLAMPKGDANPEDFWDLAGRSGWLRVRGSREADGSNAPLPGQRELPHPDVEAGKDRPRSGTTLEATAELRNRPIPRGRGGFTKPQAEIIESANITTMGQLVDLAVKGPQAVSAVLKCGDPIAEEIVRRVYAMGGDSPPPFVEGDDEPDRAPSKASPVVSSSATTGKSATPDMDNAEEFVVPMEGTKHWACITAAPLDGGEWSAGWHWEDETDEASGGCVDADMPGASKRQSKEQAVAAAAGQLVDSIQRSERPKSKAGKARREKAVAACQTFYAESERGGKTIFEAAAN